MTMIQAYRRAKPYTHTFPDVTLKFAPNELGHVVCDVADRTAAERLLAIPTGFRLYGNAELPADTVVAAPVPDQGERFVLASPGGDKLDLRPLDDEALHKFAAANGLTLGKLKGDKAREAIVAFIAKQE